MGCFKSKAIVEPEPHEIVLYQNHISSLVLLSEIGNEKLEVERPFIKIARGTENDARCRIYNVDIKRADSPILNAWISRAVGFGEIIQTGSTTLETKVFNSCPEWGSTVVTVKLSFINQIDEEEFLSEWEAADVLNKQLVKKYPTLRLNDTESTA